MGDGPQDAAAAVAAYEGVGSGLLGQLLATHQCTGWFLGQVDSKRKITTTDRKRVPDANIVIRYHRKTMEGKMNGWVAHALYAVGYGPENTWVLLRQRSA